MIFTGSFIGLIDQLASTEGCDINMHAVGNLVWETFIVHSMGNWDIFKGDSQFYPKRVIQKVRLA